MIILASTSPRRSTILSMIVDKFIVMEPSVDEEELRYLSPSTMTKNLSKLKAYSISSFSYNDVIIACDTIVIFNDEIFEKPKSALEAQSMLTRLSNNTHIVLTSYTILYGEKEINKTIKTYVTFNTLSKELISDYVASKLWVGKAGGYGIQDEKYDLVNHISGSYFNVMGFPLEEIKKDLKSLLII
ncbi:MAG: nucleoside triphosphate pyrophosphatase [Bacilli bacterium]